MAGVHFSLNRIDEGVAEIRKSLQFEPENPAALSTLALFAINTGDQAGARDWLRDIRQQPRILPDDRAASEKALQERSGQPPD